jgi:hypothetical protein
MRQIIEGIQRVAVTLAQVPLVNEAATGAAPPGACSALLIRLHREYPGQLSLGIADPDGQLVCTTRGTPSKSRIAGSHLRRALDTGGFVIGGYGESGAGGRYLSFAYPLRNDTGQNQGAIVLGLDLAWLAKHMRERYADVDAVVGLADRDLTYLMRIPDDATRPGRRKAPSALLRLRQPFGTRGKDPQRDGHRERGNVAGGFAALRQAGAPIEESR